MSSSSYPPTALGENSSMIARDLVGGAQVDVYLTSIHDALIFADMGDEKFEASLLDLPDEAWLHIGASIPLDLNLDGVPEYLKGAGPEVQLWRLDGTWKQDPVTFPAPGCALVSFAHGDFNGDGVEDVAHVGAAYNIQEATDCDDEALHGIDVLLGTETGELLALPRLLLPGHRFYDLKSADIDGDGRDDLVALTSKQRVLVLPSYDDGFAAQAVELDGESFIVGNVDGDPEDEVVLYVSAEKVVKVLDRALETPQLVEFTGIHGRPVAVADVNGDGVGDIVFNAFDLLDLDTSAAVTVALSNP